MKQFVKVISLALAFTLFGGSTPVHGAVNTPSPISGVHGIVVRSAENQDFPSAPNLSIKALKTEIQTLVDFAAAGGQNALFFEARPQGESIYKSTLYPNSQFWVKKQGDFTFFDPMQELVKQAADKGQSVYATITLEGALTEQLVAKNLTDLTHLMDKYDLAGVVLSGVEQAGAEQTALLAAQLRPLLKGKKLGVMLEDGVLTQQQLTELLRHADMVIPKVTTAVGFQEAGYIARLKDYQALCALVLPLLDAASVTAISPELSSRSMAAREAGFSSQVINGYRALKDGKYQQGNLLLSMGNKTSIDSFDLPGHQPKQSLSITRPTASIKVNTATYFITGTSNPSLPLTVNGVAVERETTDGTFGYHATLQEGANYFGFKQGEKTVSVNITRFTGTATAQPIHKITTAYPKSSALLKNGETVVISCVAPSGGTVSATVAGVSVALTQNIQASPGIPATYSGSLTLSGAADGAVENAGVISYTLSYNGTNSNYQSGGSVYLVGTGARPQIHVTEFVASVFYDEKVEEGNYKSVYKQGTVEEITAQMGEYYKLASGGYIKKATVEVLTQSFTDATIASISAAHGQGTERFVLQGAKGLPYTFTDLQDGSTRATFYGTNLRLPQEISTQSTLFASMVWKEVEGGITCTVMPADPRKVWGFDALIEGEDTVLYAKGAPTLSKTPGKPLENITVVVDPGHGGKDSGALGTLGLDGPFEKHVNLANSQMLQMRLEQLGARVVLTRPADGDNESLYDRMEVAQKILPDLFIALHHNSIAESSNGYKSNGVEAYYYEPFGKSLGEAVVEGISKNTADRKYRFVEWGYFTVTRMRYAPSILTEIAFLSNPVEYMRACNSMEIYKTADAIATAILKLVSEVQ